MTAGGNRPRCPERKARGSGRRQPVVRPRTSLTGPHYTVPAGAPQIASSLCLASTKRHVLRTGRQTPGCVGGRLPTSGTIAEPGRPSPRFTRARIDGRRRHVTQDLLSPRPTGTLDGSSISRSARPCGAHGGAQRGARARPEVSAGRGSRGETRERSSTESPRSDHLRGGQRLEPRSAPSHARCHRSSRATACSRRDPSAREADSRRGDRRIEYGLLP